MHLGKRVREHAGKAQSSSLVKCISSVPQNIKVTLYLIPVQNYYDGLDQQEFYVY